MSPRKPGRCQLMIMMTAHDYRDEPLARLEQSCCARRHSLRRCGQDGLCGTSRPGRLASAWRARLHRRTGGKLPTGDRRRQMAELPCGGYPAGVRHALNVGGDPLAVFYPEPNVATFTDLVRFGALWDPTGRILVAQTAALGPFRALYEDRTSLSFAGEMLDDLVDFVRAGNGPPLLDPRVARVIEWLGRNPADLTPLEQLVRPDGLSVSRFLHLFSDEIGVPFRRFRIWNRLRAASSMALRGTNLTDAAISAGFRVRPETSGGIAEFS